MKMTIYLLHVEEISVNSVKMILILKSNILILKITCSEILQNMLTFRTHMSGEISLRVTFLEKYANFRFL